MDKVKLGHSDVEITKLCFGATSLGGMPETYGYDVDEQLARDTIHAIFDSESNVLDTSRNYGFGRSEERIGQVIKERGGLPKNFLISTKLDRSTKNNVFDADQARRSLEESLEALSLDSVDILHLHDPEHADSIDPILSKGGAIDELFKMKEEGIAKVVGLAMGPVDLMLSILKDYDFDVIITHNRYTILNRNANEVINYAYQNGISVLNAAPFASGILAAGSKAMPRVCYMPADQNNIDSVKELEKLCAQNNIDLGAAALQFSLRDKRISGTIVGVGCPKHVQDALKWYHDEIPNEFLEILNNFSTNMDDPEATRDYKLG
ncbi:MAG: aldo/keto reductase [Pseudomonadota bacterium]